MDLSQNHQQLQDNGYTIVENLIDHNFVDELVDEIKKLEKIEMKRKNKMPKFGKRYGVKQNRLCMQPPRKWQWVKN